MLRLANQGRVGELSAELADAFGGSDLERARMENEDLRTKALSPYGTHLRIRDPGHRWLTWREVGTERNEMCEQLSTRIGNACDTLHGAKRVPISASNVTLEFFWVVNAFA